MSKRASGSFNIALNPMESKVSVFIYICVKPKKEKLAEAGWLLSFISVTPIEAQISEVWNTTCIEIRAK